MCPLTPSDISEIEAVIARKLNAELRSRFLPTNSVIENSLRAGEVGQQLVTDADGRSAWSDAHSYTLYFQHLAFSPADSTTYYFGAWRTIAPHTSAGSRYCVALRTGSVRSAAFTWLGLTAAGSNENVSLYVRNVTAGTEELIETIGNTAQVKLFNNYAMSLAVTQGDLIEAKLVCPAWGTNPTGVDITGHVLIGP